MSNDPGESQTTATALREMEDRISRAEYETSRWKHVAQQKWSAEELDQKVREAELRGFEAAVLIAEAQPTSSGARDVEKVLGVAFARRREQTPGTPE